MLRCGNLWLYRVMHNDDWLVLLATAIAGRAASPKRGTSVRWSALFTANSRTTRPLRPIARFGNHLSVRLSREVFLTPCR